MALPQVQILTVSKLNRLDAALRAKIRFYAPLVDHLYFTGIEPVVFIRASSQTAVWRDGASHNVGVNVPRFEYSGETQLGLKLKTSAPESESLAFSAHNKLSDSNTLIWIQGGVAKSTPTDTNPFDAGGTWIGAADIYLRDIVKAGSVLSAAEIAHIQGVLL